MLDVVLYQPEIPQNAGNIIRLCANTGFPLHLIRPLGFTIDDRKARRAGLDYHELANMTVHDNLEAYLDVRKSSRIFGVTTKGTRPYHEVSFEPGDALFWPRNKGFSRRLLGQLSINPSLADSHDTQEPQSEFKQCRRRHRVRSVAPASIFRRGLIVQRAPSEFFSEADASLTRMAGVVVGVTVVALTVVEPRNFHPFGLARIAWFHNTFRL